MTSYGHVNPYLAPRWQMMASREALDGWILFGLTTAFLFAIVQKAWSSWLGVHIALLNGLRVKVETFVDWVWNYCSQGGGSTLLDRSDAASINWHDDDGNTTGPDAEPAPPKKDAARR